jgi:hypothetical protein
MFPMFLCVSTKKADEPKNFCSKKKEAAHAASSSN